MTLQDPGQQLAMAFWQVYPMPFDAHDLWCRVINRYRLMYRESIFA